MSEKVIFTRYLFFASSLLFLSFIMKDLILQVKFGLVKEKMSGFLSKFFLVWFIFLSLSKERKRSKEDN